MKPQHGQTSRTVLLSLQFESRVYLKDNREPLKDSEQGGHMTILRLKKLF